MRSMLNATVSFGAIYVPVGIATAAKRGKVEFRQLHVDCAQPLNMPHVCKTCDPTRFVPQEEIVKAYEIAKGQFVLVDEGEIERFVAPRSSTIEVTKIVPAEQIGAMMVEKSYFLMPSKNSVLAKPYEAISASLMENNWAAFATATLWKTQYPVAIMADEGVLVLKMLFCADEITPTNDVVSSLTWEISAEAKEVTSQYLSLLRKDLVTADLTNRPRELLLEYIAEKAQGEEISYPEVVKEPGVTIDYLAVMKEAIAARAAS